MLGYAFPFSVYILPQQLSPQQIILPYIFYEHRNR
jgi:hypothetical protein